MFRLNIDLAVNYHLFLWLYRIINRKYTKNIEKQNIQDEFYFFINCWKWPKNEILFEKILFYIFDLFFHVDLFPSWYYDF